MMNRKVLEDAFAGPFDVLPNEVVRSGGEQAPGGDATKKCAAADGFAFTRKWILSR